MTANKETNTLNARERSKKAGPMSGKICLVTGATAGIGKVTATALAAQGAEVVIHGRNPQKTNETQKDIIDNTGNKAVHALLADFADLDQVREMAENFHRKWDCLDVLVNNAGAFFNARKPTPYGVEMTLLVNHLAPFLLTNLVMDAIRNSPVARIINVSSEGHRQGTMNFDDLGFERSYFGMKAYGRSKLANILFTYELTRRLGESPITVNALHPGHVATDIWKTSFPLIGPVLKWVMGLVAVSPEEGAENSIYLAAAPQAAGVTGKYLIKHEAVQSSALSYDEVVARQLWEISQNLTGLN